MCKGVPNQVSMLFTNNLQTLQFDAFLLSKTVFTMSFVDNKIEFIARGDDIMKTSSGLM